jgi:putative hemolysin
MTEAVEWLGNDTAPQSPSEVRFSYSRPEQQWANRMAIRLIERLSGQPRLERLYRGWSRNPPAGENIFAAAIRLLDIKVETDAAQWAKVPATGPVLFIANHPFGVIDGLLMGHLATQVRADTKIMTHSLLCQAPEARDYLLPVDFGGTPQAQQTSLLTRRRTLDWLAGGHAVAVFPAGGVSTAQQPFTGPALESAWHPFVARLARLPGLSIVPVYFHGQNSRLFQVMSHIHYALRIALLFRETARLGGQRLLVSVGTPLTFAELAHIDGRDGILRELRQRTLSLAGPSGPRADLEFRFPARIRVD